MKCFIAALCVLLCLSSDPVAMLQAPLTLLTSEEATQHQAETQWR